VAEPLSARLSDAPLDVAVAFAHLQDPLAGGVSLFVGTTRGWTRTDAGEVATQHLSYEAYRPMALAEMERLLDEAAARWPLRRALAWHRLGSVAASEASVIVGAACPHRDAAFACCRWLIDTLKARVPIYKREHLTDGSSFWVESHWPDAPPIAASPPPAPSPMPVPPLDYGSLEGGLVRMMDRYHDEGTLTGDPDEDAFVSGDPVAALLGLLFDQRVRAEFAFTGPKRLHERLGHLDLARIAEMDAGALAEQFAVQPAVHRFTNKMAEMTVTLAQHVTHEMDGDATRLWSDGADAETVSKRARKLPGFGAQKAHKLRFVLHYFGLRDFSGELGRV
jgi:uncharacterized HhH-GPD family protein